MSTTVVRPTVTATTLKTATDVEDVGFEADEDMNGLGGEAREPATPKKRRGRRKGSKNKGAKAAAAAAVSVGGPTAAQLYSIFPEYADTSEQADLMLLGQVVRAAARLGQPVEIYIEDLRQLVEAWDRMTSSDLPAEV